MSDPREIDPITASIRTVLAPGSALLTQMLAKIQQDMWLKNDAPSQPPAELEVPTDAPSGLDLAAVRARAEAATAGPWTWDRADRHAEFVTHALTDVPALLAEIERLRAEVENPHDEYHTMAELYEYRMLYNALAVNAMGHLAVKSWRHSDGDLCFGGGWFVVYLLLPSGQVSNHYKAEHWDLFSCPEVETAPEYDGHTPAVAAERMYEMLRRRAILNQMTADAQAQGWYANPANAHQQPTAVAPGDDDGPDGQVYEDTKKRPLASAFPDDAPEGQA